MRAQRARVRCSLTYLILLLLHLEDLAPRLVLSLLLRRRLHDDVDALPILVVPARARRRVVDDERVRGQRLDDGRGDAGADRERSRRRRVRLAAKVRLHDLEAAEVLRRLQKDDVDDANVDLSQRGPLHVGNVDAPLRRIGAVRAPRDAVNHEGIRPQLRERAAARTVRVLAGVRAHLDESLGAELVGSHDDARNLAEPIGERVVAAVAAALVQCALDADLLECRVLIRRRAASLRGGSGHEKLVSRQLVLLLDECPAKSVYSPLRHCGRAWGSKRRSTGRTARGSHHDSRT